MQVIFKTLSSRTPFLLQASTAQNSFLLQPSAAPALFSGHQIDAPELLHRRRHCVLASSSARARDSSTAGVIVRARGPPQLLSLSPPQSPSPPFIFQATSSHHRSLSPRILHRGNSSAVTVRSMPPLKLNLSREYYLLFISIVVFSVLILIQIQVLILQIIYSLVLTFFLS